MVPFLRAAAFAAALSPAAAAAATFDTLVSANTVAPSITGTISGVGFTMTGFLVDDEVTILDTAYVGFDGTGFGVAGVSGDAGTQDDPTTPKSATDFTIDGIGVDVNEMLRVTFDQQVELSGLHFAQVDRRDDVFLALDGVEIGRFGFGGDESLNTGGLPDLQTLSLSGQVLDIVAGYPNQTCAASNPDSVCGGHNDLFQLTSADVAPVPLPAGLPMLLAGLGLASWVGRRRARA